MNTFFIIFFTVFSKTRKIDNEDATIKMLSWQVSW